MIDFIQSEFKKVILHCCKKNGEDVALVLGGNLVKAIHEGQEVEALVNTYDIIPYQYDYKEDKFVGFNWDNTKQLTINEVLGVKIDILGYGQMSEPFIVKSIMRFSENHQINPNDISIFCLPTIVQKVKKYHDEQENEINELVFDKDGNPKMVEDVAIYLYDGRTADKSLYLKTITFSDLFREEDIEMPQII